jgi:hypothetical protein
MESPRLSGGRLVRAVVWHRQDGNGAEYFELRSVARGWELAGSVVLAAGAAGPVHASYSVICDERWTTREARVSMVRDGAVRELTLRVDSQQRWWNGAVEVPAVRGLLDVDLAFTPSTNTPPIRRLELRTGQGQDVTAAWITFPDLDVVPLPQRYERLADDRYRYASRGGEFTAEIETDDLGLVVRYPPGWERIA